MQTLTPRQMDILRFLRDDRARHGYSPTMQETGDYLHLSKVTVFEHVGALEKKGLLRRQGKHKARSLQITREVEFPDESRPTQIPLVGTIAAGHPLDAVQDTESVDLEEMFSRPRETFCLRVNGESMIDEQIRDGDYVVCEKREDARDGETVVALLEGGEATLKKLFRDRGRIRLQPANPDFEPIVVDHVDIQGVVVGVIRRL
jgi:repressor LexA